MNRVACLKGQCTVAVSSLSESYYSYFIEDVNISSILPSVAVSTDVSILKTSTVTLIVSKAIREKVIRMGNNPDPTVCTALFSDLKEMPELVAQED